MAKRGSGSSSRTKSGGAYKNWDAGISYISQMNIQGTEKQVKYAKDILERPFQYVKMNVNRYEDLAKKATRENTKKDYQNMANEMREFGSFLSTQQYKPMAESKAQLKASNIIQNQSRYDGNALYNQWRRVVKKKV